MPARCVCRRHRPRWRRRRGSQETLAPGPSWPHVRRGGCVFLEWEPASRPAVRSLGRQPRTPCPEPPRSPVLGILWRIPGNSGRGISYSSPEVVMEGIEMLARASQGTNEMGGARTDAARTARPLVVRGIAVGAAICLAAAAIRPGRHEPSTWGTNRPQERRTVHGGNKPADRRCRTTARLLPATGRGRVAGGESSG